MYSVYANVSSEPATISPTSSSIMAGGNVTLTCSVTLPLGVTGTPDFQWEGPGGVTLTPAASMTSGQNFFNDLPLNEIATSQAGQYTCTATLIGSINTSTTITVQSRCQINSHDLIVIVLFFTVSQPDVFATLLRFEPGTSITIGCTAMLGPHTDNNEHVAIEWSCPGDSACTGQRYSTTPASQGHGSDFNANITISPPTSQDMGTYMYWNSYWRKQCHTSQG